MFLSFACTDKKTNSLREIKTNFKQIENITLKCDSTVWSPRIVGFYKNNIITRMYSADNIFYPYQINGSDVIANKPFGKSGSGPNEIKNSAELFYDETKEIFYMFDVLGSIVDFYTLKVDSIEELSNLNRWNKHSLPNKPKYVWKMLLPLSDTLLIGIGGATNNNDLMSKVNIKTKIINGFGVELPNDGVKADDIVKRYVYNDGELLKRPSSNQYLYYCTNWGNYAEILTLDKQNNLKNRKIIADVYPDYTTHEDGMNRKSLPKNLMGMRAYSTESYIYILPNFKNREDFFARSEDDDYPSRYSNKLYKFEWDGNFVEAYTLSKPINYFVIDPQDKFLIGMSLDLETSDYTFEKFLLE